MYDRNNPMGATLYGTPVYLAWYAPGTLARVQGVANAADLQAWLQEAAITHVIWNMANHDTPGQGYWLMEDHLGRHGIPLAQAGTQVLYQLQSQPLLYQELYRGADLPAAPAAQLLGSVVTGGANIARIRTTYSCETDSGSVILQLLWDRGPSWFRFMPCSVQPREYTEAILVPPGAMSAGIFNSVQQNNHASLDSLTVEIN